MTTRSGADLRRKVVNAMSDVADDLEDVLVGDTVAVGKVSESLGGFVE